MLVSSVPASKLTFDQSIESLFSESSPYLNDYRSSKSWFGGDDQTTAVILRLLPEAGSPLSHAETIARLRALAGDHPLRAYVVGEPVQMHDRFRYLEQDGELLFRVSLGKFSVRSS